MMMTMKVEAWKEEMMFVNEGAAASLCEVFSNVYSQVQILTYMGFLLASLVRAKI